MLGGAPGPKLWVAKWPVFPTLGLPPCPEVLTPTAISPVLRVPLSFHDDGQLEYGEQTFFFEAIFL